ncbi:MAG TPA: tRNA (guanosine(37)-N1)-methyltransferase TrmD [Candidatus Omnitrophica bacterium]|nr:tRNA (guanosine(37)-N1)-methyltransferase TrmD [Candidatus Omnitrophota bacterium]
MRIDIISIFPKMFEPVLGESIIKRAQAKGLVKIKVHDLRSFTLNKHKKVDDRPYGGGPGMVMGPQPIFSAVKKIKAKAKSGKVRVILLSPKGKTLTQNVAKKLTKEKHLILICGHYEGVDERVREYLVNDEISIGDYILTGGELPAMVLLDSIIRLVPKVLGKDTSNVVESFEDNLLEYPQYTRPESFNSYKVPKVLLSGDHKKICDWRKMQSLKVTKLKRPDLLKKQLNKK